MRSAGIPVALVSARTRDGVLLNGVMAEPARGRRAALVWVHGLGSSFAGGQPLIGALSRRLNAAGVAYLKLDTRGHHVVARAGRRLAGAAFERFGESVRDVRAMIDLARDLGATVLNFFFLVRTGRGRDLTDIDAAAYEEILTYLAKVPGAGQGPPSFVRRMLGMAEAAQPETFEDPWSTPIGRADGLLIRAKCAPHFRRILWELNPSSPLLKNYAHGSCPAGKYYCRITPEGDVTPCPYMPVSAGNLRATGFAELWRSAPVFGDLRDPKLGGRCGACEFSKVCGGCRCRAFATYGDYLAEDPACGYQPGAHGGAVVELPATLTFGLAVDYQLTWEPAARERLNAIPSFARGMVVKAVEAYARSRGESVITPALLADVRGRWGGRFRPQA